MRDKNKTSRRKCLKLIGTSIGGIALSTNIVGASSGNGQAVGRPTHSYQVSTDGVNGLDIANFDVYDEGVVSTMGGPLRHDGPAISEYKFEIPDSPDPGRDIGPNQVNGRVHEIEPPGQAGRKPDPSIEGGTSGTEYASEDMNKDYNVKLQPDIS